MARVLQAPAGICPAFDPRDLPEASYPTPKEFSAIWDTGAMGSVVTQAVVDACGLKATGMMKVHGVHGAAETETFLVNMTLPNKTGFINVKVTKGILRDADVLIGMDIISRGDFAVTNYGGKTVFSFRCPSVETIDFNKSKPIVAPASQLRNSLCNCGSGKKFKKCCGKLG